MKRRAAKIADSTRGQRPPGKSKPAPAPIVPPDAAPPPADRDAATSIALSDGERQTDASSIASEGVAGAASHGLLEDRGHVAAAPSTAATPNAASGSGRAFWQVLSHHDWLAWLLLLAPLVGAFLYVQCYGVEWEDLMDDGVPLFQKFDAGTLSVSDFSAQVNEHRHFFPRIAMFLIGLATHCSPAAERYFLLVLYLAMLVIIVLAMRRARQQSTMLGCAFPFVANGLQCPAEREHAQRISDHVRGNGSVAVGVVLRCRHANQEPALEAQIRHGHGFGVRDRVLGRTRTAGLACRLCVWRCTPFTSKALLCSIWAIAAIAEYVLYFWGYVKPPWHPDLGFAWGYLSAIVGGSLFPDSAGSEVGGHIAVPGRAAVLLAFCDWGKGRHLFWLAMIFFGLLIEGQITVAEEAGSASSRHWHRQSATFSLFIVTIGTYGILSTLSTMRFATVSTALWARCVATIAMGIALSTVDGLSVGRATWEELRLSLIRVLDGRTQPNR